MLWLRHGSRTQHRIMLKFVREIITFHSAMVLFKLLETTVVNSANRIYRQHFLTEQLQFCYRIDRFWLRSARTANIFLYLFIVVFDLYLYFHLLPKVAAERSHKNTQTDNRITFKTFHLILFLSLWVHIINQSETIKIEMRRISVEKLHCRNYLETQRNIIVEKCIQWDGQGWPVSEVNDKTCIFCMIIFLLLGFHRRIFVRFQCAASNGLSFAALRLFLFSSFICVAFILLNYLSDLFLLKNGS